MQLSLALVTERGNGKPLLPLSPKEAYRNIRNYLAGQFIGATRDETLLHETLKCLFCKLYLTKRGNIVDHSSDPPKIASLYKQALKEVHALLPSVSDPDDILRLDPASIAYVHLQLDAIAMDDWNRDPFGDAYEAFVGSIIRGQEGQFFTPQNAVNLLVTIVDPRPGERVIDPACGAGGFLSATARHLVVQGASPETAAAHVFGVDKDRYLSSLASARLSFVTLAPVNVFCADSLAWRAEEGQEFALHSAMGTFDVVLTNPPFGSRIIAVSPSVQRSFDLGHRWRLDGRKRTFTRLAELQPSVPPQVLFIERCLALVRPGGRIGMVVPESLISGKVYRHVVEFIRHHADILSVIGMPESLFKSSGKGGTHTKTCLLVMRKKSAPPSGRSLPIFMAEAQWCGNDSRGRELELDDLPEIAQRFEQFRGGTLRELDHLGYAVSPDKLVDNILAPRYYSPDVAAGLALLQDTHDMVRLGDLVAAGLIQLTSGDEIGKLAYGTGPIPFVRTSDISNWEIKVDPKHCVSDEIYQSLAKKQDVREGDILMVRDGTYLIGTCALITKYDIRMLFQSHLYKLRVTDRAQLSPYLLLALLSSAPVRRQIKAKRFTQDIIDSLGDRIHELVLPIPKNRVVRERVTAMVKQAIQQRIEARELARRACQELVGDANAGVVFDPDAASVL
ncbi:MAG: N-6 DNA methylase [Chloroflexi bacterium]|nr:N-6 DNA methylase [Chloroflexota bacterium]